MASALDCDLEPDAIMKAIQTDPQAVIKLREIESNERLELRKLVIEADRLELQDRANARAREIETTRATGKRDLNLYILAWVVVGGFFGLCAMLFLKALPQGQIEVVYMLFGTLATGFGGVLQYFFGSSKSSSDKTRIIAEVKK